MTYNDRLNAFDRWLESNPLPSSAMLLYIRILMYSNKLGWPETLQVDNLRLMTLTGIKTEKTLIAARDKLVAAGLIEYRKGKKGCPNRYTLKKIHCKNYSVNDSESYSINDSINDSESDSEKVSHNKTKTKTETKTDISSIVTPSATTTTTSTDNARVRDPAVAAVIGDYLDRINPSASQYCLDMLVNYARSLGPDVCRRAFDIALDAKITTWNYIKAILQNWTALGVKCLADIDRLDKKRGAKTGGEAGGATEKFDKNANERHGYRTMELD